jgi:GNAT superfamily N-acetyltransferase
MDISTLLDLNILEKFACLPSLTGMEVFFGNEITIINSGISSDMFNIVCRIKIKDGMSSALEKFRRLKIPFALWLGFNEDYPDCKTDLEEVGFVCDEHESAMFIEIEKLSRHKKCKELRISLVNDEQKLRHFIDIYGELISHDSDSINEFYSKAAEHILDPQSSLKLFVGYFKNQPAATSALFTDKNTAGVWDVVTLLKFRRKGIGTDMTAHALLYAFDNFGHRIGVLTASEEGEPVYRKIGFQKLKDFYIFNIGELI